MLVVSGWPQIVLKSKSTLSKGFSLLEGMVEIARYRKKMIRGMLLVKRDRRDLQCPSDNGTNYQKLSIADKTAV